MTNAAKDEFLTIKDLCNRWKKHPVTVRKMIKGKKLPPHYKIGGTILFKTCDIKEYEKGSAVKV